VSDDRAGKAAANALKGAARADVLDRLLGEELAAG